MKPYIPKQTRQTRERVEAKIETSLFKKLERYCTYLDSDRDYVISQALEIVFKRDKGFEEWLASQYAYLTMLFSTPYILFSVLLSLAYIFVIRQGPRTALAKLPAYPEPAGRERLVNRRGRDPSSQEARTV